MSGDVLARWQEQNREFLALAIDELHARVRADAEPEERERAAAATSELRERMEFEPALERLAEAFELGGFGRDLVLLCVACELDPRFRTDPGTVTVGYALEALSGGYWGAFDASGPLLRWGIVELDPGQPLADGPLRVARDVLRYLLGFDPRVDANAVFSVPHRGVSAVASQARAAEELARAVALADAVTDTAPAIELHGADDEDRMTLAQLCAAELGASVASADARDLPAPGPELDALLARWNRLSVLTATLIVISGSDADDDPAVRQRIARALDRVARPFFISVASPTTAEPQRPLVRHPAPEPTPEERTELWWTQVDASRKRLGIRKFKPLRAEVAALATQFRLGARAVERICLEAESLEAARAGDRQGAASAESLARELRAGCRRAVRARLDPLAERIPLTDVPDVALPEPERRQLEELRLHIQLSYVVNSRWGLARDRESSLTAMFAGPSGTGKTHAAMALANDLGLELYRVNVAAVLSKYIGETEQNLDRVFRAARVGGAILLFDEADALFGKRTEVKDAHDRYANLGTAYLLQRIENSPTPTILTTNLKEGIDPAFMRRLHFVIDFPFPSERGREEIWSSIFPPPTPTRELDPARLAQIAVTGGTISGIARRGAFLAAADTGAVEMRHLREGAARELRKAGRDLSPEETAGWP